MITDGRTLVKGGLRKTFAKYAFSIQNSENAQRNEIFIFESCKKRKKSEFACCQWPGTVVQYEQISKQSDAEAK